MVDHGLRSGDRLPEVCVFVERLGMSEATIREGFAILEAQGLVETRAGSEGGLFVGSLAGERAQGLLAGHLLLADLSVADIYQIRRLLEPDLAASLAGRMPDEVLDDIEAALDGEVAPRTAEEARDTQVAALAFHARLAAEAENALLGALVSCLARALSEMVVAREGEAPPGAARMRRGEDYRRRLVRALRDGNAAEARRVMLDHLETALHLVGGPGSETRPRLIAE